MKSIITKIVFTQILWLICVAPLFSYADQDCNRFWWDCYVDGVNTLRTDESPKPTLINTVKRTINFVLALLATVATLICMYAWFKMLTSWWDSKWYDAGLKILKNAALWLAIIALAWIIVSGVLRFIDTAAEWNSLAADAE